MYTELVNRISEGNYVDLLRKQRSITRLFPTFYNRVKKVASKGGVRMYSIAPTYWHFKVTSATIEGVKYDNYVGFKGIESAIKKNVPNQKLWKSDGSGVDLRKLAAEVINDVDFETHCSCPADLYYGGHYIRTTRDEKYDGKEYRPPDECNPKKYGLCCKHAQLVLDVLPMYVGTFAKFLKDYYSDTIAKYESEVQTEEPNEEENV